MNADAKLPMPKLLDAVLLTEHAPLFVRAYDYERLELVDEDGNWYVLERDNVRLFHAIVGEWLGCRLEPYVRGDGTIGIPKPRGGE